MENKGKLLVTTQASKNRKIIFGVFSIMMLLLAILFIINFEIFREMGNDLFDNSTIGIILGIFLILSFIMYPVIGFIGFKSYCNVYENSVTGMTGLSISHPNEPMQKFDINYNEIINVTESGKTIFIHTQYTKYEILAMTNRDEAIKEIKKRMTGNE